MASGQPIKPQQPVIINWANPLTRGLVFDCPLFGRGDTSPLDLVNKQKGVYTGSSTIAYGPIGTGIGFTATNNNYIRYTEISPYIIAKNITMETWFIAKDTVGWELFSKPHASNAHSSPFFSYAHQTFGSPFNINVWFTTSGNTGGVGVRGSSVLSTNTLYHSLVTYDGTTIRFYLNGKPDGTSTSVSGTITNFSGVPLQVVSNGGGTEVINGSIYSCRLWNRVLSFNEATKMYVNPWGIYQRPDLWTPNYSSIPIIT